MKKLMLIALVLCAYGLMAGEREIIADEEDTILIAPAPEEFLVGPVLAPEVDDSSEAA